MKQPDHIGKPETKPTSCQAEAARLRGRSPDTSKVSLLGRRGRGWD